MDHGTYKKMADLWNKTTQIRANDSREFCELSEREQNAFRDGAQAAMTKCNIRPLRTVLVRDKGGSLHEIEFSPSDKGYRAAGNGGGWELIPLLHTLGVCPTVGEYSELVRLSVCPYDGTGF